MESHRNDTRAYVVVTDAADVRLIEQTLVVCDNLDQARQVVHRAIALGHGAKILQEPPPRVRRGARLPSVAFADWREGNRDKL